MSPHVGRLQCVPSSSAVQEQLTDILVRIVGCPADSVVPGADLKSLGVDSLTIVELGEELGRRFGIYLSDDTIDSLRTVQDAIDAVVNHEVTTAAAARPAKARPTLPRPTLPRPTPSAVPSSGGPAVRTPPRRALARQGGQLRGDVRVLRPDHRRGLGLRRSRSGQCDRHQQGRPGAAHAPHRDGTGRRADRGGDRRAAGLARRGQAVDQHLQRTSLPRRALLPQRRVPRQPCGPGDPGRGHAIPARAGTTSRSRPRPATAASSAPSSTPRAPARASSG